jgi:hypothetical protein
MMLRNYRPLFTLVFALSGTACAHAQLDYQTYCATIAERDEPAVVADAAEAGWTLRTAQRVPSFMKVHGAELCFSRPKPAAVALEPRPRLEVADALVAAPAAPADELPHRPVFTAE